MKLLYQYQALFMSADGYSYAAKAAYQRVYPEQWYDTASATQKTSPPHIWKGLTGQFAVRRINGDEKKLTGFLKTNPNICNEKGQNFFHLCVLEGESNNLHLLKENHVDINARDNDGKTPLDYAYEMRRGTMIATLHSLGAEKRLRHNPFQVQTKTHSRLPPKASSHGYRYKADESKVAIVSQFTILDKERLIELVQCHGGDIPYFQGKTIVQLLAEYGRFDVLGSIEQDCPRLVNVSSLKLPFKQALACGCMTLATQEGVQLCFRYFEVMVKEEQSSLTYQLIVLISQCNLLRDLCYLCLQIKAKDELLFAIELLQKKKVF
ncbi:ankyrin repeat domain-containing protein [Parashewanella tropica]|uniref:ankyrin repeat domain-containing protein n=1 Tax=Parashewanella tropica TaxID=2547970 RepID=UPI001478C986|nr:ankyrin repeat domain-containing protein [Parashewanella tropica]